MVNDKYVVKYLDPRTGKYEYATIKDVGDLQKLNTKVKTSIVDAINSISTDGIDGIDGLRNDLDTIGKTIKSLEDGTLELGDFQSIDDVVSREIEDAINSLKDENSGLLKLTQEEIDKIVSDAESEYRDSIAASVRELETSKSDLEDAREKMTSIGQMLENADINYSSLTQVVDDINLYITDVIEKTDFDMVNGIVSDYKTAVTQSKDGWGVDASKNMLSYLTGRVKNNETSLDVQHGLIQAKVGKDEFQYMTVDNLPAGKENMLHNTSDLRDWDFSSAFIFKSADDYRFTSIIQSDSAGENIIGTTDELEQGVTYAISTYVNVQSKSKKPGEEKYAPTDGDYTATVIIDGDTIELSNVVEDNSALDGWKRVSGTFVAKRTAQQDIKFYVTAFNRDKQVGYLSAPKLEKGSSATSWIPHIEDNVSTILSQNAVMRVLSDRITSSVEEVRETKGAFETATSTFDQMADGFALNTNKLSEVLDKYGEVTGVQTQQASELKVLNESITSKVWKQDINTTLDTINIDTSNRIVNSAFNIYSYDEQTGALKLDYWDNNTGFEIKKHSQSLDNYLYAKRSNATSVNPISIKSSPFALRDGEKILFNFEYLAVGNPLDNDNVITLEMYDNDDVRVGLQEFKLSELKKEFLTAYDVGDSYKYNGSYIVKNSSVVKGTITLKLPKNGELWLTRIMLQNAGIGTIGWTPSSIDNQIIQSKLSTEINQLADSIELVAKDERLDAISGLLVKKDGKITISPEAIISRVTSQELGDNALITQTSIKQTEESLRFDLVDKDGIIQTINASAEEFLIDFDKVRIDGEVIARMISAQSIDATQGFRLTDNNGNTLLGVVNDNGTPTLSIAKDFNVKFKDFSNKLDVTVVNVVDEYYHSTDESKPVGGQWTSAPNDFRGDTFVWKRTKVVLQSGKEYYLPDENGINITSGWNYAKGEVTNAIESAIEEAEQASQSAQDADGKASTALEKAGTNANVLTTHQNTLNTISNTTLPDINKSLSGAIGDAKSALSSASSAMDEAKKADGKIADYVTKNGLVNGTTVDSKIDTATGEISKKITTVESKIPTEIGGRNYLTGTSREWTFKQGSLWFTSIHRRLSLSDIDGKVGDLFTASVNLKPLGDQYVSIRLTVYDPTQELGYKTLVGNAIAVGATGVSTVTMKIDENVTGVDIGVQHQRSGTTTTTFEYKELQFEKGKIPTAWTPAPEDNYTQEEFKIFESTYDEDVKGIRSSLSSLSNDKLDGSTYTTFYKNEYEKTAEGLRDAYEKIGKVVDENGNTTDTFAKAVYDRNATRRTAEFQAVTDDLVKTATYEDGIDGVKKSITTVQGKLDNLGSPNLLKESWHNDTDNPAIINTSYNIKSWNLDKKLEVGKTYTFRMFGLTNRSKFVLSVANGTVPLVDDMTNTSDIVIRRETAYNGLTNRNVWEKTFTLTQKQAENMTSEIVRVYNYPVNTNNGEIYWATLVEGSAGIDWSPALSETMGKADFQVFKNDYDENDKEVKQRLLAIDSGKEGSVIYNTNEALSTAKGNKQTITTLNTKVDGLKIGVQNLVPNSEERIWNWADQLFTASEASKVFKPNTKYAYRWELEVTSKISVANASDLDHRIGGHIFTGKTVGNEDIRQWYMNSKVGDTKLIQGSFTTSNSVNYPFYVYGIRNNNTNTNTNIKVKRILVAESDVLISDWTPALADQMGKAEFTLFKNDYDKTAKGILSRLTAIDSSAEGSVVTRLNKTEKTASGNTTTISNIKTKPGEQITGYQTITERSNLYERVIGSSSEASVKQNLSRIVMTDSAFKVDVADKLNAISTYTKIYSVNTANPKYITDLDGNNLNPDMSYDITLGVRPTGTVTYFFCSLIPDRNGSWNLIVHSQGGTSSNHPYVEMANGYPRVRLYGHTSFYDVHTTVTETSSRSKSALTMLSDNINLKVSKGDLISQINVQAGSVLINSGTNKLNVTPTTTYIENGTIKSAMIESIKANQITTGVLDASKITVNNLSASSITTGVFDASKFTVKNLDASSITANQAELVKAGLKGSSGGTLELTGDQFLSTSSDGSQVYLQNGVMGVRRPTSEGGGSIGQIGYVYDGGSPTYTIQTSWGSHFALKQRFYDSYTKLTKDKRAMYISTGDDGNTTMQFYAKDFVLQGDRNLRFGYDHYINGIGNDLTLTGKESVTVRANERTIFVVSSNGKNNYASMYANLNMQGNTVTNTSDIRLKRDIVNDEIDSLSALMKWQHAGFNYINPNMNQERQFSVIAQSAPDIAFTGEDGYLQVALNKQVNMTSHALQQLGYKVIENDNRVKDKIKELENKITMLELELKRVRG